MEERIEVKFPSGLKTDIQGKPPQIVSDEVTLKYLYFTFEL